MSKKIGWVGLGRLGTPVAACLGQVCRVVGYDVDPTKMEYGRRYPHRELGLGNESFQEFFDRAEIDFDPLDKMRDCEIIFVAVQTPHEPEYEGITQLTSVPKDFDYSYLTRAAKDLAPWVSKNQTVVIISTCLPGAVRRHVLPWLGDKCSVVYNPFFIAMGTVVRDFARPEFVLLGGDDPAVVDKVQQFYSDFYSSWLGRRSVPPFATVSIESAELTKVLYNTHISNRITLASYAMEICHKTPGCDVDQVTGTLKLATERILGPRYMDGGLSDSGPCHPRDNIAMSWLAGQLDLSYDPCGTVTQAREFQTEWLAELIEEHCKGLPIVIIGKAYKPETDLVTGSSALLLANILRDRGVEFTHWDPHVDGVGLSTPPALFFVATKHECFQRYLFPSGSTVIDPFRYLPDRAGVRIIRVGKGGPIDGKSK